MTTTCFKCATRNRPKVYMVCWGNVLFQFDVEKALALAKDLPVEVAPEWLLEAGMVINDYEPEHIDHVDMNVPLLFGCMPKEYAPESKRDAEWVAVFLDGSHRAARSLRDKVPVKFKLLCEPETMSCVIETVHGDPELLTQLACGADERERKVMIEKLRAQGLMK